MVYFVFRWIISIVFILLSIILIVYYFVIKDNSSLRDDSLSFAINLFSLCDAMGIGCLVGGCFGFVYGILNLIWCFTMRKIMKIFKDGTYKVMITPLKEPEAVFARKVHFYAFD